MADTDRRFETEALEACAHSSREDGIPEQETASTHHIELQQVQLESQSHVRRPTFQVLKADMLTASVLTRPPPTRLMIDI